MNNRNNFTSRIIPTVLNLKAAVLSAFWLMGCSSPAPQPSGTTITYSGSDALVALGALQEAKNRAAADGRTPTKEENFRSIERAVQIGKVSSTAKEDARAKAKQQGRKLSPEELEQIGNDATKQYEKLHPRWIPPSERVFD